MTATNHDENVHEDTPLLANHKGKEKEPNPLPKLQLSILMLLQLAEPMTSQCIYPFINQLISELDITGGDERKVGYYAGMIQSMFFATEALFILQWSLLSDRIGRKPVLLTGSAGLCLSMICFGLSKTFWGLVISRCLVGLLNGNIGVMKSMVAELADSTNLAQAFSFMPVVWSIGATFGPFMGGSLARPHDRWPHIFSGQFWVDYPYFLPCAGSALFSACAFMISAIFLKETVKKTKSKAEKADTEQEAIFGAPANAPDGPLPLRKLLVWPVLVSVANYGTLALLEIAYCAIQPLFLSTPIEYGGLGQSPASIGVILGFSGLANGSFQLLFFAKIVRRWGTKRIFTFGLSSLVALFALFPIINMIARRSGTTPLVWALVGSQLCVTAFVELSYGCIFMFITSAAPNRQSLGSTNGIGQFVASVLRAVGPASATSLFALSVERNWMGGYAVFVVLIICTILSLFIADLLPENSWSEDEQGN